MCAPGRTRPRAVYRQTWERLAAAWPEREDCKTDQRMAQGPRNRWPC